MLLFTTFSLALLAGPVRAQVTSIVLVTEYVTNCFCSSTSTTLPLATIPLSTTTTTKATLQASIAVTQQSIAPPVPVIAVVTTPGTQSTAVVAPTISKTSASAKATSPSIATQSIASCPAGAHIDALGSKNYPRVIQPVSSLNPNTVYGPQYFASLGGGNSTIFTFDYQHAGTCTLEFKFPSTAQIKALQGTTSYQISGASIAVTLYQLNNVASIGSTYSSKPTRGQSFTGVLAPGTNTTFASFPCPTGTSVSYELVSNIDNNKLSFFEDYNPPPLGLLALMC